MKLFRVLAAALLLLALMISAVSFVAAGDEDIKGDIIVNPNAAAIVSPESGKATPILFLDGTDKGAELPPGDVSVNSGGGRTVTVIIAT